MNREIIVFGATGNTGLEICKQLESKGLTYSVFVRKGSESKVDLSEEQIFFGDVLQKDDVDILIKKFDFTDVIIALGSRDFRSGEIRSKGTKYIVDALVNNGKLAKIHVVSANGVGESWGNLTFMEKMICKLFIPKAMKDHELQEEIVKTNKGGYHIIRPVGLTNEDGVGKVIVQSANALPNNKVSRVNLANYLVNSMLYDVSGAYSICNG
jgi:NAD(P)-dependent dehydrogenase (short-subunit alcohol dehydrogenase family)